MVLPDKSPSAEGLIVVYDSQLGPETSIAPLVGGLFVGREVHEPYSSTRSTGSRTEMVACWPARLCRRSSG
jgi:hypothetical protein